MVKLELFSPPFFFFFSLFPHDCFVDRESGVEAEAQAEAEQLLGKGSQIQIDISEESNHKARSCEAVFGAAVLLLYVAWWCGMLCEIDTHG